MLAVADTHTILWYIFADARLSSTAKNLIHTATSSNQIGISSISLAEIVYLAEKGKIAVNSLTEFLRVIDQSGGILVEIPFNRDIVKAMSRIARSTVPDMPDRMIAATALYLSVPLVSRDGKIQASGITTIW